MAHFPSRRVRLLLTPIRVLKQALFTISILLSAVSLRAQPESDQPSAAEASRADQSPPPLDPKNMDPSVRPQDDFFTYANGSWRKNNPIPPEYSRWGSFDELIEKNNDALHQIAERAAMLAVEEAGQPWNENAVTAELKMVGDFYASGMNEEAINRSRFQPLQDELERIEALQSREDLAREIGHLHSMGIGGLFGFTSGQDDKNSLMVIAQAYQGGLGLPDSDYYTKER